MTNHQQILIDVINKAIEEGMTARQIATNAGVDNSVLSRFINGKQDIQAGDYFSILNILPENCRVIALTRLGMGEISAIQLIQSASPKEKAEILQAFAQWVLQPGVIPVKNAHSANVQVAV